MMTESLLLHVVQLVLACNFGADAMRAYHERDRALRRFTIATCLANLAGWVILTVKPW